MKITLHYITSDTDHGMETTFYPSGQAQDKAIRALIEQSFAPMSDSGSVWPHEDALTWKTIRRLLDKKNQADLWEAWSLWKEEQARSCDYYSANSEELDIETIKPVKRLLAALRKIQTEANFSENDGAFDLGESLIRVQAIASGALSQFKEAK